jgi:hypothetical protein
MTVSSMIGSWFRLTQTAANETCNFVGGLADSLFVDYTIEENLLLLNRGKTNGEDKPVSRGVPTPEASINYAHRKRVRDRTHPISNKRDGFTPPHRPPEQAR